MDSRRPQQLYQPSALPARIDLNSPDTHRQLARGSHQPKIPSSCYVGNNAIKQDKKEHGVDRDALLRLEGRARGRMVIEENLQRYIRKLKKKEPTLDCSSEDVFVSWLRYFHREYDDMWFNKNYKRLTRGPFREVFNSFNSIGTEIGDEQCGDPSADLLSVEKMQDVQEEQVTCFDELLHSSEERSEFDTLLPTKEVLNPLHFRRESFASNSTRSRVETALQIIANCEVYPTPCHTVFFIFRLTMGTILSTLDGSTGMLSLMVHGVIMNIIQLMAYGLVAPFSRDAFRRLNWYICYLTWAPLVAWGEMSTKLIMHGDPTAWAKLARDRAIVLSNHIAGMDWLMMWAVTERTGGLPACKALLKDSLRFIPFLGWSWACADYPFLTRQWEKDKKSLLKSFEGLRQYSSSYLLTIFAEGTRMTTAKLRKSQEFAKSKGWNVLKNVLLPKTKGFTASVNSLGDQLDCIFDATLASPPGLEPTLGSVITGRPSELHVLLERIPISSLPLEDDAKLDKWLRGRWSVKDDNITKFLSNGSAGFPGFPRVDTFKRRIFPRVLYRTIQSIFIISVAYLLYKAFRTEDEDVFRFRMRVGAALIGVMFCMSIFLMKMSKPKAD